MLPFHLTISQDQRINEIGLAMPKRYFLLCTERTKTLPSGSDPANSKSYEPFGFCSSHANVSLLRSSFVGEYVVGFGDAKKDILELNS